MATMEEEFEAVFHLHLHCRHNNSNAKTPRAGYKKIFKLTDQPVGLAIFWDTGHKLRMRQIIILKI